MPPTLPPAPNLALLYAILLCALAPACRSTRATQVTAAQPADPALPNAGPGADAWITGWTKPAANPVLRPAGSAPGRVRAPPHATCAQLCHGAPPE